MQLLAEQRRLLPIAEFGASPARACRRRPLLSCLALAGALLATTADAAPPCSTPGTGWCLARRFSGSVAGGELGFRFGDPLDVDGDGHADIAAGARFTLQQGTLQNGTTAIYSGATGSLLRTWDGEFADGLSGHWVMPIPDISGDGLADVVIAAPHAPFDGHMHGIVMARSPKTGTELWRHIETAGENLGWDMDLAGDQNGDGHPDLFVGAPAADDGRVYLLSGADGTVLQTYTAPHHQGSFGWYVARLDDLDGDGRPDLVAGAPYARDASGAVTSFVWVLSAATGKPLLSWTDPDPRGGFGSVVAGVGDLDGDRKDEVVVGAPGTEDPTHRLPGELRIYSSTTGKELRHWTGRQPGEQFGRMVVAAGDLDGDGVGDVAIGAPWFRRERAEKVGRVELRSGRTGTILGELIGDEADDWFGWHIRRAPDPEGRSRPTLLIASLRHPVDGKVGVGVVDLLVLRRARKARR